MTVVWDLNSLANIGGNQVEISGSPIIEDSENGKAILFNGINGALLIKSNPINNFNSFTIEMIFRPDVANDPANKEQRFLHIQDMLNENSRILLELRITDDGKWFMDTFIKSNDSQLALYAENFPHPVGKWYKIALVYENGVMKHFVDGIEEMSGKVEFIPISEAHTSIGVRINHISWFKGAIQSIRFSDSAVY